MKKTEALLKAQARKQASVVAKREQRLAADAARKEALNKAEGVRLAQVERSSVSPAVVGREPEARAQHPCRRQTRTNRT
jgi:hypothetical protein